MITKIFPDITNFITDWNQAQSMLTNRDRETFTAIVLGRQTRTQIAKRYQVSNQRAAQLADRAVTRFRECLSSQKASHVLQSIASMRNIVETAGLKAAYTLGRQTPDQSAELAQQLINTEAITHEHSDWALAVACLLPLPSSPRASLRRLPTQVRTIVGEHHLGASPEHVVHHLDSWRDTFATWPSFDFALHVQAITGIRPDPETGTYHPLNGWPPTKLTLAYQLRHHIALALAEAGTPLTASEITVRAVQIAQRGGLEAKYTTQQVAQVLKADSQYRWVGQSTYGLSGWDIGHSPHALTGTNRVKVADEIAHVLQTSHEPVTSKQIEEHILSRFNVTEHAVHTALHRPYGDRRFIINPDHTVSIAPS